MKIIKYSIVALTLLATTSFADHHRFNDYKGCKTEKSCEKKSCNYKDKKSCGDKSCDMKKHNHKYMKKHRDSRMGHRGDNTRFLIGAVYALDLKADQEKQISTLLTKFKEERFKAFEAFKKDGFNKEEYIKIRLEAKEKRIKAKAELIDSIYKVLTPKQKAELKQELEDFQKIREQRKQKRGMHGPSCDGRR